MSCMCGGCLDCLIAQGCDELPETCLTCHDEIETGQVFCSARCQAEYEAAKAAETDAMVTELAEIAALAAEWKQRRFG